MPHHPKKRFLALKKTLYGLKRSPQHWFEKCVSILKELGFKQCPNSPCLFYGVLIEGQPPIYLGVYIDDIAYFSESDEEAAFEEQFGSKIKTKFNGIINYFLGIKFTYKDHKDGHISCYLTQEAFIDNLVKQFQLDGPHINCPRSPYHSGLPVDKIPKEEFHSKSSAAMIQMMQSMVGSLTWLSTSTHPDIATITNILAKYTLKANRGHINAAKRVINYLRQTRNMGIAFHSRDNSKLESFVKFPLPDTGLHAMCDANWGPQDQSQLKEGNKYDDVDLFKSRSLSGYIIWY